MPYDLNTFEKKTYDIKLGKVNILDEEAAEKAYSFRINNLDIKTNNEDNPLSSIINKYMLRFEGDIIQKAIKFFGKNADVPMFDGIMINKKFSKEVALDFHLESLNDLFKDEFNGLIKFSIKSTDSDIELNLDNDFRVLDYSEVKPKFEKNHFLTIKPFAYWKRILKMLVKNTR